METSHCTPGNPLGGWQYQPTFEQQYLKNRKSKRSFAKKFFKEYSIRHMTCSRSSRPEVFCKKGFLKNFANFTEKHLCQSLLFNKVAGLRRATLLKKRPWHRSFPMNFAKFLRTPFHIEHLWTTASNAG